VGRVALVIAVIAAAVALALTAAARRAALAAGFVDKPGERKIHDREVACAGGFALAATLAFVLGALALFEGAWDLIPPSSEDPAAATLAVVVAGALGALLLGFIDDLYQLSAWTKLAVQVALAIGTVAGGVRITAFIGDGLLMQTATVCWIVLITNSFNLLDNMDGLCAGTVAIAAALLALVAFGGGQAVLGVSLAALSGACLGFLKFNRAPATIFLGDTGSLFCGYLMACATVLVTYYRGGEPSHLAIGIPLLILAIPLYDTASVMAIRLKERRPLLRGDTSHFSHRLVDLGMTRRQAVATIHLACLAIGLPATVLGQLSETRGLLIIGQGLLVLTLVALLERAGRGQHGRGAERRGSGESRGG
jgi:UDP-GlcNAc:undecaprenyl-phosphate/decaprenyl-phosphate GlcNAc-1-phosphate transferase